jgi:protein gp37
MKASRRASRGITQTTGIEWTNHTANPWQGCTKIAAGCRFCYAEGLARNGTWGPDGVRANQLKRFSSKMHRLQNAEPGAKIFVGSMCDLFEQRADLAEWRDEAFKVMDECPDLKLLLLTKRPAAMRDYLMDRYGGDIPPHYWTGASAAVQKEVDANAQILAEIPSRVRWLSLEPLIREVTLHPHGECMDWIVVGGESVAHLLKSRDMTKVEALKQCRPMNPEWALKLRDECEELGIPFFYKQLGSIHPGRKLGDRTYRLLQGRTYDEFPGAA